MLANLTVNTILVPFATGLAFAAMILFARTKGSQLTTLLFPIVAALLYCLLEGLPSFPPVGAKQKLPLLLPLVSVLFIGIAVFASRISVAVLTLVAFAITTLAIIWIGQNILASNPGKFAIAEGSLIIFFFGTFKILAGQDQYSGLRSSLFIPAAISVSFGAAILSALGAFLGMAQANGALAAFLGAMALASVVMQFRQKTALIELSAEALLAIAMIVALFMSFGILFAPKVVTVAALLVAAPPWVPVLISTMAGSRFLSLSAPLRFIIGGLLTTVPSILAIAFAVFVTF